MISVAELLGMGQAKSGGNGVPFVYINPYADASLHEITFYLHDHLGNTRVTYTAGCKTEGEPSVPIRELTLVHAADYHPYGSILREWRDGPAEKYLTTHHERDLETGLDYRGARYYDADVARFLSLDPLAADYASWSAYNYVMGNPASLVDLDGRSPNCGCPDPPCPNDQVPPSTAQPSVIGSQLTPSSEKVNDKVLITRPRSAASINHTETHTLYTVDYAVLEEHVESTMTIKSSEAPVNINIEDDFRKSTLSIDAKIGPFNISTSMLSQSFSYERGGIAQTWGLDYSVGPYAETSIDNGMVIAGTRSTIRPSPKFMLAAAAAAVVYLNPLAALRLAPILTP